MILPMPLCLHSSVSKPNIPIWEIFYQILKLNGTAQSYVWLDRHPHVCAMVALTSNCFCIAICNIIEISGLF